MTDYGPEELPQAYPTPTVHLCVPLPQPDKQIRLLELDAVNSHDPNIPPALYGRLYTISLPSDQDFTALSYVWGQKDPGTSQRENRLVLYCGDHQHEVRLGPNCWSALWHISNTRGTLKIWVDALCIEQGNDEEKSRQIALMRTIYASAHTTYFWLGEATKGTDEAMDYLSTSKVIVSSGRFGDVLRAALELFKRSLTLDLSPHQSGLREIFNRSWIERLWTLQECLLAQKGIMICGEKSIHWPDLICALESLHYFRTMSSFLYFQDFYDHWLNLAHPSRSRIMTTDIDILRGQRQLDQTSRNDDWLDCRVQRQLWCLDWAHFIGLYAPAFTGLVVGVSLFSFVSGWRQFLAYMFADFLLVNAFGTLRKIDTIKFKHSFSKTQHPIVQELRTRKATDSKDMYYGVAGILNDESPTTKGSLCDHYRALCINLIQQTESLDMLLIANSHSEDSFPSWVIDWKSATPQIWDKALFYFSARKSRQHVDNGRSSISRPSKYWTHLFDFYFEGRLPSMRHARQCLFHDQAEFGFLHIYEGATTNSKPSWEFCNHGQDLHIRGLLLTHISSHNMPPYTGISASSLRSAAQALASTRNQDISISETGRRRASTNDHLIEITGSQATGRILDELRMLTAFARSAFSGMTESKRMVIEKGFESLREVIPGEVERKFGMAKWWHKLRMGINYPEGRREEQCLLTADKLLRDNQATIADFLKEEELIMVRCEATASCKGGLGFAGAAAQAGDAVALVSGVSLPLVLRGCGQRGFRLIGPLFLPGVMDGELKDLLTPDTLGEIILV